jgi:hypothetical protein
MRLKDTPYPAVGEHLPEGGQPGGQKGKVQSMVLVKRDEGPPPLGTVARAAMLCKFGSCRKPGAE